jgi:hypothetical protein
MLWLLACVAEEYDVADLQLDIDAAVNDTVETARSCITGVGYREEGAGIGRLATPGIPVMDPIEVQVDLLDPDGVLVARSELAALSQTEPYQVIGMLAELPEDAVVCEPEGAFASETAPSLLLVVRFLDAPW